jgi:hypothetical protein
MVELGIKMETNIKKLLEETINLINNLEIKGNNNIIIASNVLIRLNQIIDEVGKGIEIDNTKEVKK